MILVFRGLLKFLKGHAGVDLNAEEKGNLQKDQLELADTWEDKVTNKDRLSFDLNPIFLSQQY